MAFTTQDIVDELVYLGNDDAAHSEFPLDEIIRFTNEAIDIIVSLRPDTLLETDGTLLTPAHVTNISPTPDTIDLPDKWKAVIVDWILKRGYQSDSRDVQDVRQASVHKKEFQELVESI